MALDRTFHKALVCLAVVAVLVSCSASAFAQNAAQNDALQGQAGQSVPYISGGVGSEGLEEITAHEKEYNLKVIFAGKGGAFLSDIDLKIMDSKKKTVTSLVTEGPVLLVKLAAGHYTLQATLDGKTVAQKVSVTAKGLKTLYVRFPDAE